MVVCLLATAIVVAALMAYLAISLQRHNLQQLATQKDKLTAEVSALQEQAEARRNNGSRRRSERPRPARRVKPHPSCAYKG